MIENAKRNYFKSSFKDMKGDSRSIWKLIKSLANNKSTRQPEFLTVATEKVISTATEMADFLNLHFTTIANKITQTLPVINDISFDKLSQFIQGRTDPDTYFSIPCITTEQVTAILSKMPSSKATGADGVSIALLKLGLSKVAPSIARLINRSFVTAQFPSRWKTAKVMRAAQVW